MKPLTSADPSQIGPHRVLAVLGAGGMGKVYLARTPDRHLAAVKVIHQELAENPSFRARFTREVRAAHMVRGPFTPAVFDAAPEAGAPWMATEYVPGPTLTEAVLLNGPFPGESLHILMLGLARAMQAIHGVGLIHRDVKPGNVLLSPRGPQVIDFGIVRAIGGTVLTKTGEAFGTPAYAAPETVLGLPQTPESDIFSLAGVVVYAARGMPPFGHGPAADVLNRIVDQEADLRALPEGASRDLLARCLAKESRDRPTANDIIDVLSNEPLPPAEHGWLPTQVNQEIGHREQEAHHVAGHPQNSGPLPRDTGTKPRTGLIIGAAVASVLLLAGAGLALVLPWESESANESSSEETTTSEDESGQQPSEPAIAGSVYSTHFTPDGEELYVHTSEKITLWDWREGEFLKEFAHEPHSFALGEDGTLAGAFDDHVTVWGPDHSELARYEAENPDELEFYDSVSLSPDGTTVVFTERTVDDDFLLRGWDWESGEEWEQRLDHAVAFTKFAPSGAHLVLTYSAYSEYPRVEVLESQSLEPVLTVPEEDPEIDETESVTHQTAFSPTGELFAVRSALDETLLVHDLAENEHVHELHAPGVAFGLTFTHGGDRLVMGRATGGSHSGGSQWDISTGEELTSGNTLLYAEPTLHPNEETLVVADTSSRESTLLFLDPDTLQDTHEIG